METIALNVNSGLIGTLGAVVQEESDARKRYILSCNHVIAWNGRADEKDDIVWAEFANRATVLGKPHTFVLLKRYGTNTVDCALALISDVEVKEQFPADTILLKSAKPTAPQKDMKVEKFGAATGKTNGTIVDVDVELNVDYSFGTFRFENQVMIDSGSNDPQKVFANDGDSGSLAVSEAGARGPDIRGIWPIRRGLPHRRGAQTARRSGSERETPARRLHGNLQQQFVI